MNIYEKLQAMRVDLQGRDMKKTGKNTFSNYSYFELGDFLPEINSLMQQHKVCSAVRFGQELATLTLFNAEKPDEIIEFTSPMSTAALKGCHEVQNLGAVQTYIRRYLYTAAFEIVEHDALDATTGKDAPKAKPATQQKPTTPEAPPPDEFDDHPTGEMLQELYRLAESKGKGSQGVIAAIGKSYGCTPLKMTLDQYHEVCNHYASLAAKSA